jgi:hypothetical protein
MVGRHRLHWTRWLLLALLAAALAGCDAPAVSQPRSRSQEVLERTFKDPKARQLAIAAERGDAAEVRRLMKDEHVNPDVIFSDRGDGFPLLAWPILTQSAEGLRAMLENGADPNAHQTYVAETYAKKKEIRGYDNAMVFAIQQQEINPIYLKLLLEHGGDPSARYSNGETLLYKAFLWQNQWQYVRMLIEHGADINAGVLGSGKGKTILFNYAGYANFDKVYWLLERGAKPTVTIQFIPPPPAPPEPPRVLYGAIEDIYWYPVKTKNGEHWQRKCQIWLLRHGYPRPPMTKYYRELRQEFGYPTDEKDIPLPELPVFAPGGGG